MLTRGHGVLAALVALIGSLFAAAPVAHADPPVCLSWTSTGYCILWSNGGGGLSLIHISEPTRPY